MLRFFHNYFMGLSIINVYIYWHKAVIILNYHFNIYRYIVLTLSSFLTLVVCTFFLFLGYSKQKFINFMNLPKIQLWALLMSLFISISFGFDPVFFFSFFYFIVNLWLFSKFWKSSFQPVFISNKYS